MVAYKPDSFSATSLHLTFLMRTGPEQNEIGAGYQTGHIEFLVSLGTRAVGIEASDQIARKQCLSILGAKRRAKF